MLHIASLPTSFYIEATDTTYVNHEGSVSVQVTSETYDSQAFHLLYINIIFMNLCFKYLVYYFSSLTTQLHYHEDRYIYITTLEKKIVGTYTSQPWRYANICWSLYTLQPWRKKLQLYT